MSVDDRSSAGGSIEELGRFKEVGVDCRHIFSGRFSPGDHLGESLQTPFRPVGVAGNVRVVVERLSTPFGPRLRSMKLDTGDGALVAEAPTEASGSAFKFTIGMTAWF